MKKLFYLLLAVLLLTGCTPEVDLMEHADPDSSGLFLYYFDGEAGVHKSMFETKAEKEIMEAFHNAKAELLPDFDPTGMKPPFYAIEMGGGDHGMIHGLWSDGVFLTRAGEAYAFDYDFEALLDHEDFREESTYELTSFLWMPCAAYVVKSDDGWHPELLPAAQPGQPVEGITMRLVSADEKTVTVEFSNASGAEWDYGMYYHLEVLLDGQWYQIPTDPELDWGFNDIAYVLMDGKTSQETYRLEMYGDLPAGNYRIVAENLTAEFEVT